MKIAIIEKIEFFAVYSNKVFTLSEIYAIIPQIKPLLIEELMAVIYPHFLQTILGVHENLLNQIPYPFFDSACIR